MKLQFILYLFLLCNAIVNAQSFIVNFNNWVDNPILKTKLGVTQPPLAQGTPLIASTKLLSELNLNHYRFEYGWGKESSLEFEQINKLGNTVQFKIDNPNNQVDQFFSSIKNNNIKPMFVHDFAPTYLQQYGNWQNMVKSLDDWSLINRKYAEHMKAFGFIAPYYEIWNAPDMYNVFFMGSRDEYILLYKYGANGIKAGDPDAQIGGISSWIDFDFMSYWLDFVTKNKVPVDFVSIHAYEKWIWNIKNTREVLNKKNLHHIPIYLTEWMSVNNTNPRETCINGLIEKPISAVKFFNDILNFNTQHDLTQVYWAQWRDGETINDEGWQNTDEKIGLISLENQKKPLFNAFKLYSWLPVDRKECLPDTSSGVKVVASSDDHNASILLVNSSYEEKNAQVVMNNLPFNKGTIEVFRIDNKHGSIRDCGTNCENNLKDGSSTSFNGLYYTWKGQIPAQSVCLLKLSDNAKESLLTTHNLGQAKFVRSYYWFNDRTNDCYADFDPKTWIARLGSGIKDSSYAIIGNVINNIPAKLNIKTSINQSTTQSISNANFGIRVDYQSTNGVYSKSVYFYDQTISKPFENIVNWGTERQVNEQINCPSFLSKSGITLDIAGHAPTDWNKQRVIVTFILINAPKNTQTRFILSN